MDYDTAFSECETDDEPDEDNSEEIDKEPEEDDDECLNQDSIIYSWSTAYATSDLAAS